MTISFHLSALRRTKWSEYAIRFCFGGAISVLAGILAHFFGPAIGGLFLAFPAIFPASATLMEKHESEKKKKAGILKTARGRQAAALDAYGAALGCIGLAFFALITWKLMPDNGAPLVMTLATGTWVTVTFLSWTIQKKSVRLRALKKRVAR
ncbi:MAG TPA: DUF3147 family protein [Candidatus Acidoferrum sp.]|jgi:hypothetical protein